MVINIEIIIITIKAIFNVTKHTKPIIDNLIILIKVSAYVINHLNLLSLYNIFNNIHKMLLTINNIIKIIITIYITVKFLYITIIRLINRLQNG